MHSIIAEGPIDIWAYTNRINLTLFFEIKMTICSAKVQFLERRGLHFKIAIIYVLLNASPTFEFIY